MLCSASQWWARCSCLLLIARTYRCPHGSKSCYKHAVPVYSDTIRRDAHEVRAIRAPEPKEQTRDPAWTYRPG